MACMDEDRAKIQCCGECSPGGCWDRGANNFKEARHCVTCPCKYFGFSLDHCMLCCKKRANFVEKDIKRMAHLQENDKLCGNSRVCGVLCCPFTFLSTLVGVPCCLLTLVGSCMCCSTSLLLGCGKCMCKCCRKKKDEPEPEQVAPSRE